MAKDRTKEEAKEIKRLQDLDDVKELTHKIFAEPTIHAYFYSTSFEDHVIEGLVTVNARSTIFAVWGQAITDKIKELMENAGFKNEEVKLMKSSFFKALKVPYYDRLDQVQRHQESEKQVSRIQVRNCNHTA
jgi:hypothetical protein